MEANEGREVQQARTAVSHPSSSRGELASRSSFYYICDKCGSCVTITDAAIPEDENWECADCGSQAMWEFTNKDHALAHANHIRRGLRSGLFRQGPA